MWNLKHILRRSLLDEAVELLVKQNGCVVWPESHCLALIDSVERDGQTRCRLRMRTLLCGCDVCSPPELADSTLSISYPVTAEPAPILLSYDQPGDALVQAGFIGTGESCDPSHVFLDFQDESGVWMMKFAGGMLVRQLYADGDPYPAKLFIYWPPQRALVNGISRNDPAPFHPIAPRSSSLIRVGRPRGGPSKRLAHRRR